jgi:hypothetical protein
MVETLYEKIKEAEQQIIRTIYMYDRYSAAIKSLLERIENIDSEYITLLWELIKTMESILLFNIGLKALILNSIDGVLAYAEIYQHKGELTHRNEIIKNVRIGIETLKNKKVLYKMNNLYYLISTGEINVPYLDYYLEKVRDRYPELDQETQIIYARREAADGLLKWIIEGLLKEPTMYEQLYKQLIETNDLREFVKYLPKYI